MKKAPTTLIVLDGFGVSKQKKGNAIRAAKTPVLDRLRSEYAHTTLAASGADVGLPDGLPGNAEAGLLNIEAGRIVPQELPRVSRAIEDGTFFANPVLCAAVDACLEHGTSLHLMGLLSDGGTHASMDHLYALLKLAAVRGLRRVYIHGFLDGYDVRPGTGRSYVAQAQQWCAELGVGKIATLMGRSYAMDRDENWERVEEAYDALVYGDGAAGSDPAAAVTAAWRDGVKDWAVEPVVFEREGTVGDNDAVIFYNIRADRASELTRVFVDPAFNAFNRETFPLHFVCLTEYGTHIPNIRAAFPRRALENELGEYLASVGMEQLRVRDAQACVDGILSGRYDVVRLVLSGCDDAGHGGDYDAVVRAVQETDFNVGRVVDATLAMGGIAMIAGSHGNAEELLDAKGRPTGANTVNRVPFLLCGAGTELREGRLADVAPTLLDVLGLAPPPQMDGETLILR